jgi:phage baseplate assembly protein W
MGTYSFKSSGKTAEQLNVEQTVRTALPIGIRTPLRLDDKNLFAMNYSISEQIHDNLRNLLLTNWGERLGFYNFGANLQELTSELSNIDAFDEEAISRIRNAVQKWMPFVVLKDFVSEVDNERNRNTGIVKISITYSVPQLGVENKALQISLYVI